MAIKEIGFIKKVIPSDGVYLAKFGNKNVSQDFVRRYYGTFAVLAGLNPCSRDLIDYLVDIMDDDNIIMSNEYTRDKFLEALKESTLLPDGTFIEYSDSNIKKAYQSLVDRDCLIKIKRGVYKVNPEYYFRKSERKRIESIKLILEFKSGVVDSNMKLIYDVQED